MNKFLGLLKREHMINGSYTYLVLAVIVLTITFMPIGMEKINPVYIEGEMRFLLVVFCAIAIGINAVIATITSINKDVKIKELWLHTTHSIYSLIGVKIVYQLFALLVIGFVNFIGLFFVGEILSGTVREYIVLALIYFYLLGVGYLMFVVCIIFINSLTKQLSVWVGKLSSVIVFIGVIMLISFSDKTLDFTFLQIGPINFSSLEKYLPTFNSDSISISTIVEIYVVEEIVITIILIVVYVVACKWLERVITR